MTSQTAARTEIDIVNAGFEALARGDAAGFAELFHADATWHHRNDDRFSGVHRGRDRILAYVGESAELTGGTLRPLPQSVMADGAGHVAVLVRLSAARPDGRSLEDLQMLLFTLEGDRVRGVEQFVGDPAAVSAFWA